MNLLLRLVGMFLIAQLLGIYAGSFIIEDAKTNEVVSYMLIEDAGPETIPWFVFAVLFGAGIFLFIARLKIPILFTLLEIAVISATSSILFYSFIKPVVGLTIESMAAAIFAGLLLAGAKIIFPNLKNIAAVLASAGAGAVFGFTFGFFAAMLFLLALAIYDYISVYKTKHMVTMANEIVKRNMAFTITAKQKLPSGKESRLDLGTGDISIPIMAEVSAYSVSPLLSAWALAGAILGVAIVLFIAWQKKEVIPALPPIAAGILLFTLFALLTGLF